MINQCVSMTSRAVSPGAVNWRLTNNKGSFYFMVNIVPTLCCVLQGCGVNLATF